MTTDPYIIAEHALGLAVDAARRDSQPPPTDEVARIKALVNVAALHVATAQALRTLDLAALALTASALRADVDPAHLVGYPYGERKLRSIARQLGLPPRRPGPPRQPSVAELLDGTSSTPDTP